MARDLLVSGSSAGTVLLSAPDWLVAFGASVWPMAMLEAASSWRGAPANPLENAHGARGSDAERHRASAKPRLERGKWTMRTAVRQGPPLSELLAAATEARADVLVVGARGVGGAERLLLGSVADGALSRSPVPVLLVR